MAMTTKEIIAQAKKKATEAAGDEEVIYAAMGILPNDIALERLTLKGSVVALDASTLVSRGERVFRSFMKYLKQAVCDDFKYCSRSEEVKDDLDKYLPEIVKALTTRIPLRGNVPGWLAKLLVAFGIQAASLDALIVLLVAWLIVKGCDQLCGC